jgi:hypothetical protein
LFAAARLEHFDVVEQILLHCIDINESSSLGTALYQAAWEGLEILVEKLLKHGAGPDDHDESIRTPLQIATAKHHLGIMRLLIEGGADIDRAGWPEDPSCHDPQVTSLGITRDRAWLRWLQIHPKFTLRQAGGRTSRWAAELLPRALTPLQIAVIGGLLGPVIRLLDSGADINKGQCLTPLQIAVTMGYEGIVENLLRSGAYPNDRDSDGTILELATRNRLLLERGASIDLTVQIARGWTEFNETCRKLSCLQTSVGSPRDHVSEAQERDSSLLLDESFPQPPEGHTSLESRNIPPIVVEDCDNDPLSHPMEVPHLDVDQRFDSGYLGCPPDCLEPE